MIGVKRIVLSTIPRSGTVYIKELLAKIFSFTIVEPTFTGGFRPNPPEWDPYKFDKSYLSLRDGQLLCAHYSLDETMRGFLTAPDVLPVFVYRDPRDVAVSACLYIKYGLTHHFLHPLFSRLSESDALTLMLSGGWMRNEIEELQHTSYVYYEGMPYFCQMAYQWILHPKVVAVRFEDFIDDLPGTLHKALCRGGVDIDVAFLKEIYSEYNFKRFSQGRTQGTEDKAAHFRKGVKGDFRNYFTEAHVALAKKTIGQALIDLGYESNFSW